MEQPKGVVANCLNRQRGYWTIVGTAKEGSGQLMEQPEWAVDNYWNSKRGYWVVNN